jgi:hypothetical protein
MSELPWITAMITVFSQLASNGIYLLLSTDPGLRSLAICKLICSLQEQGFGILRAFALLPSYTAAITPLCTTSTAREVSTNRSNEEAGSAYRM